MQGSGLTVSRSQLSRAARKRLVEVVGEEALDGDLSPDDCEDAARLLVDAFLEDRITVADYRLFIDVFS